MLTDSLSFENYIYVFQIEARSIGHFKKLNQGMENKIMELQRKLDVAVSVLTVVPWLSIKQATKV